MDSNTSIQDIKNYVQKFCEDRDWDQFHSAKDLAIGIITEASEVLEHFRFKSKQEEDIFFKDPKKREDISDEMADVLYFLTRMAQLYDIDLSEAFKKKMAKSEKKYPVALSKGSNKKYTEFEE
ncbi:MAG: nucleotide pyrophosphohydrolase [Candidatus Woesearchaeota archaeon]